VNVEEGSELAALLKDFPNLKFTGFWSQSLSKILSKVPALILNQEEPEHTGKYFCVAQILKEEVKMDCGLMFSVSLIFKVFKSFTLFLQINPEPSSLKEFIAPRIYHDDCSFLGSGMQSICQGLNISSSDCWTSLLLRCYGTKMEIIISQANTKTNKEGKFDPHSLTIPSMSESDYGNVN
jgi:hypothetical protein